MNPTDVFILGVFVVIHIFAAIIFHEFGHYITLRYYGIKHPRLYISWKKIRIGEQSDYDKLNPKQKSSVYISGVIVGMIPLIFATIIFYPTIILLFIYLWACRKDIRMVYFNGNK